MDILSRMRTNHEPLLDYVRRRLRETRGLHKDIADQSGVPYHTITKISQGVTPNPGVLTVQRLADFFRRVESAERIYRSRKEVA
jgi:transcriptional regulator with XRE-family HTH domain